MSAAKAVARHEAGHAVVSLLGGVVPEFTAVYRRGVGVAYAAAGSVPTFVVGLFNSSPHDAVRAARTADAPTARDSTAHAFRAYQRGSVGLALRCLLAGTIAEDGLEAWDAQGWSEAANHEAIAWLDTGLARDVSGTDFAKADEILRGVLRGAAAQDHRRLAAMDEEWERTRDVLQLAWPAVERVEAALSRRGRLDARQLVSAAGDLPEAARALALAVPRWIQRIRRARAPNETARRSAREEA